MSRIITCADCQRERPHVSHGLCGACYQRQHPATKRIIICPGCNRERPHNSHGFCVTCAERRHPPKRQIVTCADCGKQKEVHGRGLCNACYRRYALRANPEYAARKLLATREWAAANPEKNKASYQRWHAANKERDNRTKRELRITSPEKIRAVGVANNQRRRAQKHGLDAPLTRAQWEAIKTVYKQKCAYCGKDGLKLEQDHVVPLSKGGGYTAQNIVPACRSCNARKQTAEPPKPVQTLLL